MNALTPLLSAQCHGDPHAASRLLPLVYDELRELSAQRMAQEQPAQALQLTALVYATGKPSDVLLSVVAQPAPTKLTLNCPPPKEGKCHNIAGAAACNQGLIRSKLAASVPFAGTSK
jgi:hypothetical protein